MKIKHAMVRAIIVVVGCFYYTASFCSMYEAVLKQLEVDANQKRLELGSLSNELLKKYYEFFYDIDEPELNTKLWYLRGYLERGMMNKALLVPYITENIDSLLEKTPKDWKKKADRLAKRLFDIGLEMKTTGNSWGGEELIQTGKKYSAKITDKAKKKINIELQQDIEQLKQTMEKNIENATVELRWKFFLISDLKIEKAFDGNFYLTDDSLNRIRNEFGPKLILAGKTQQQIDADVAEGIETLKKYPIIQAPQVPSAQALTYISEEEAKKRLGLLLGKTGEPSKKDRATANDLLQVLKGFGKFTDIEEYKKMLNRLGYSIKD